MKKILGLDLGSASIGWALTYEPEKQGGQLKIAAMGVRIIPLTTDDSDEFSKGNAISKNATRTQNRGTRRCVHRYKLRRDQLKRMFIKLGMMPTKELFELTALDLYLLRDKALKEEITLQELGRVFFHMNQKRGYKSNRKAQNEEDKEKKDDDSDSIKTSKKGYLDLIADREKIIAQNRVTIGQYLYVQLCANPLFRVKENIFMRFSYIDEFNKIWDFQSKYHPIELNEVNKMQVRDGIIYYQRPLKSQKGLVSVCEFEGKSYKDKRNGYEKNVFSGPKVTPKSSPLFQVAKIWQELNNVEITSFQAMKSNVLFAGILDNDFNAHGKRYLTQDEKVKLFNRLNWGEKLVSKDILKELGYKSGFNEYKINLRNEKFMEGNRTLTAIQKVFDKHKVKRDDLLQFNLSVVNDRPDTDTGEYLNRVEASFEKEPLYQLWHLIYSVDSSEELTKVLVNKYRLSESVAKDLAKIDFLKQGYGNMSARALRNIVPFLMNGAQFSEACEKAGYNHSNSLTKTDNEQRPLLDKLEIYPKNSLRQPVVEKIINQVVNLINDIINPKNGLLTDEERYAKDQFEIRVELARDLKQSAEERSNAYAANSKADKYHKDIVDILRNDLGFNRVSQNDVIRYKLWREFGQVSPYEPNKVISLKAAFNLEEGVLYDIEHIVPKSRLFDDSFSNKTLCPRALNSGIYGKNQDTAYDFMKKQGDEKFHEFIEFIKVQLNKKDGISRSKFNKLMMPGEKIPEDFIERQMQETRYISREVHKLLQNVCRNVYSSTGAITSKLRQLWGWDDILMNLQIEKYREQEQTEWIELNRCGQIHRKERIKNWTKRLDHRHHAIDALCIACTTQGMIQRINTLNAVYTNEESHNGNNGIDSYNKRLSSLENFLINERPLTTHQVENAASKVIVSFKRGKRVGVLSTNVVNGKIIKTLIPRGELHKSQIYGQISQFEKVRLSPTFNRFNDIVDDIVKEKLLLHISSVPIDKMILSANEQFEAQVKIAFSKKGLEKFLSGGGLSEVTVYKNEFVFSYNLDSNFKEKDVEYIVDRKIREIVRRRLMEFGNNPKEAFKNLAENPIYFNKAKEIKINNVRCFTGLSDLVPLHKNDSGSLIDYVSTRNNHHIAIYKDENGNLRENVVTFWEAFERKKNGLPVIVKSPSDLWTRILDSDIKNEVVVDNLPQDGWEYVTSMQQNEMFVFGLSLEDIKMCIENNNYQLMNDHIYRVQKIATKYYCFRLHTETKVDDKYNGMKDEMLSIKLGGLIRIQSLSNMNGIKVSVDRLGRIKLKD